MKIHHFVSHLVTIHVFALLGLLALWGALVSDQELLFLPMALSFSGALCGSFIKVIDTIKQTKK
jgi:hypothetical protein